MPNPVDCANAAEEEVDYGGEEDLDTVEDDGLFFPREGPTHEPDFDSSTGKSEDDVSMGNNDVAERSLSSKMSKPWPFKRDKKTAEVDDEDKEELLKEILTKGPKCFEEHKVVNAKIVKTEVAIHVVSKANDGEGGEEAMDISDDSGHFEELDENGAEILGIEKDLQDIEAQEDKAKNSKADSDRAEKALATLNAELRGPLIHHGAKFDPNDGPVVPCEMEFARNLSPFGPVDFYPDEHKLQAEFSNHTDAKHQSKRLFNVDEEISPKSREKFDFKQSETAKLETGRKTLPATMPPQYLGALPSPPLTDIGNETRRNAIGASSHVLPHSSPQPIDKQVNSEVAKDNTGYLFGAKSPWYRERTEAEYLFGGKPPWYRERVQLPLLENSKGSNAVALSNPSERDVLSEAGAPDLREWNPSAKESTAASSWPSWMTPKEIKDLENGGINGLSIASLQKLWEMNAPIHVNLVSLPQGGFAILASSMQGQGPSKAQGLSQFAFGYETSDNLPKQLNTEKDKDIRDHVTSHRVNFCDWHCAVSQCC